MAFPYKTISTNIDSVNSGSFYDQSDLDTILSGSSVDKYFGTSEQDVIQFSVYDIDGNLQILNTVPVNPIYNVVSKTYKDVDQNVLTYNYKQYNSGYIISFNRDILFDTLTHLSSSNITNGNHIVSYTNIRNIGGTPDYPLIIKNISVSRKELQLIPSFKTDTTDEAQSLINLELEAFATKKFLIRDIIPVLIQQLDGYQIYAQSEELIKNNQQIFQIMKATFGFRTDLDVINFLNETYTGFTKPIKGNDNQVIYDVFDGILVYLKNWLYTYYKNIESAAQLQYKFQYIVNKATEIRLRKLNTFFGANAVNQALITNFITHIFYDNFIKNVINQINIDYQNKYFNYLQNALNFGNNNFITILNYEGYIENGIVNIIVKLLDYLPKSVGLRDHCWISNIALQPMIQKLILNAPVVKKRFKIAGPNFNVKVDDYKSKPVNYQSSNDLKISQTDNTQIEFYKKLTELNINYSDFSEFILFSSAELRIKLFLNKLSKINALNTKLNQYASASISASTAISSSYSIDYNNVEKQINTIYNGFDGYDVYLNSLPSASLAGDALNTYINESIEYDKNNLDSLINNTPEYIVVDGDNSDYLIFLSMIGHHFDNIYLYYKKFPTLQYVDNIEFPNDDSTLTNASSSYISSFANVLLEQFGWKPISSFDSSTIAATYLTGSNSVSDDEKLKTIWNRILQNLPILYKTKGTEECVRLLANIYGIPNSLLNIKEFGGNNISQEDESSYVFDQKYYFTKYQGKNEVVVLPVPAVLKSVEFKFNVDSNYTFPQNVPIYLMTGNNNWNVRIVKDVKDKCGKIILSFLNSDLIIDDIPIFNGKIYSVLIKITSATSDFDTGTGNPSYLTFRVTSIEDDRLIFDTTKTLVISDTFTQFFYSSETIYTGNYGGSGNIFHGTIDKINIWSAELSDDAFLDHARNFDAYNNYSSSTNYSDLYYRYSVDYPINLYTGSGLYRLSNANKYYSNVTASVYNFPQTTTTIVNCAEISTSVFPYQFEEINTRQNIKLDNAGPNKYKNLKINKVTENVVARLMPTERSTVSTTVTQDSNLIGVYISPFKIRDDDINNFLGNYNLMDNIGSPNELYTDQYESLRILRNQYNTNNLAEKVLYQEFLTLYKHYFDGSFFTTARQLFPVRSKIIDGILIESSIIERNKYQNKPINSGVINDFNVSAFDQAYVVTGSNIQMLPTNISSNIAKNGDETTGYLNNYIGNYISDAAALKRRSVFVINGNYVDRDRTGSLQTYTAYSSTDDQLLVVNNTSASKEFTAYNFNLSGSTTSSADSTDYVSYPNGHLSILNRPLTSFTVIKLEENSISSSVFVKSQQTIYTTVNDVGIPDGSLPVEISSVNNDINQLSLTTS
jgi:hypothetical protein